MNDTKNLIIALSLSFIVIFGWQVFYINPKIEATRALQAQKQILNDAQKAKLEANNKVIPQALNQAITIDDNKLLARADAIKFPYRVKISTNKLQGSILLQGAKFDDLTLKEYKVTNKKDSPLVDLLSPANTKEAYFAEFNWIGDNNKVILPDNKTLWQSDKTMLSESQPITLSWDNSQGLKFFIDISIDDSYMISVNRRVENYGNQYVALHPYGIIHRTKLVDHQPMMILHEGPIAVLNEILKEHAYGELKKSKSDEIKDSKGWVGITDKYWLTAIIPDNKTSFDTKIRYSESQGSDRFQIDYLGQRLDISPGQSINVASNLFVGPKQLNTLEHYQKKYDIKLFDRAVDFGWLYFITKPLFHLLTYLNSLLGNFGLAILSLTIIIKLCLFPLANKSYISMHQLKRFQPQISDIRLRYKNDKMEANKQIMELYKREKVNPMSGCLPVLIQIPIFFALYKVLYITIEMRQAPFYGWISDLSMPDPTSIFNLFGLIPWHPPIFLMIGVWPIIMGITMYLQQAMNPQPNDPVQAKVMKALPFIFVFLFSSFPAGLVIYWAWNNTLSIIQQWFITRRLPTS